MGLIAGLRCVVCGREFEEQPGLYACPDHGVVGSLDVLYDYDIALEALHQDLQDIDAPRSMWRYKSLLPVNSEEDGKAIPDHLAWHPLKSVGFTPLIRCEALAQQTGLADIYIKDDGRNPSGSLKDRASSIAILRAITEGSKVVAAASTGNAASSLSALCAGTGVHCVVLVPESTPRGKLAQIIVHGATVLRVRGGYDEACSLSHELCQARGWYNRNTGFNPYMAEGKKTAAFEICEQLDWDVPDWVFVAVGNGCIIGAIYKGFLELESLGMIATVPRIAGVQAAGAASLHAAWRDNIPPLDMHRVPTESIADSICSSLPRDRVKAMRAVRESNGMFIAVSDKQICEAIFELASQSGVFAEPAAAAAFAGVKQAARMAKVHTDDRVVVLITGTGLKDTAPVLEMASECSTVSPDIRSVMRAIDGLRIPS